MEQREAYFTSKFRAESDGENKVIDGYFIVYEQTAKLWDRYYEKIGRGACSKSLAKNDIRALFNHDSGIVLGRNKSNTLQLIEDDYGVRGIITINENDAEAINIYERIKRGDITGASFGFYPVIEEEENKDNGDVVFTVKEADVLEISVCTFPAYPQTAIFSRQQNFEKAKHDNLKNKINELKGRLNNVNADIKNKI